MFWFAVPVVLGLFALGAFLSKEQKEKLDGKKIAILGARETGKSRFFEYIATEKLATNVDDYEQTRTRENVAKKYSLSSPTVTRQIDGISITFDLAESIDVGGGANSYGDWQKVIQSADFLLYLVDLHQLVHDKTYPDVIQHDIESIKKEVHKKNDTNGFNKLVLVANKSDKVKTRTGNAVDEDVFANHPAIQESVLRLGGTDKCKFVVGSLKDESTAKELLKNILNKI